MANYNENNHDKLEIHRCCSECYCVDLEEHADNGRKDPGPEIFVFHQSEHSSCEVDAHGLQRDPEGEKDPVNRGDALENQLVLDKIE